MSPRACQRPVCLFVAAQRNVMSSHFTFSQVARRWYLTVGIRWQSAGFTTGVSQSRFGSGVRAVARLRFVQRCRGGSRSCSATCPPPAGFAVHAADSSLKRRRNPQRHRADTWLVPRAKYRHASAAPLAGLINLQPLHSLPHSATQITRDAFAHSDGRKLPRPAKTAVRPKIPEAAMLRISAKTGNMAARLSPARKSAIAPRGFARCKSPQ